MQYRHRVIAGIAGLAWSVFATPEPAPGQPLVEVGPSERVTLATQWQPVSQSAAGRSKVRAPAPLMADRLPAPLRFALTAAFKTAYRRTHELESCRGLFAGLVLDGASALSTSHYDLPARCQRRVGAVTGVRSHRIRLCPAFTTLSCNDRVAILIHEALHTAGLSEWPQDPEAPTSREITERVKRACSL